MKKLLATTAMCLLFTTGLSGFASANEAVSVEYNAQDFFEAPISQNVLMAETNFYRGDFQQTARSVTTNDLYSGLGSSLMVSVRMSPY